MARRRRSGLIGSATTIAAGLGGTTGAQQPRTFQPVAPSPAPVQWAGGGESPGAEGPAQIVPDAAYLAELARQQYERQTKLQELESAGGTDRADTAEAIRRLIGQAGTQRQGIKEGANRAGLLYSGQLNKQLGDYESDLTRTRGDIELDRQRRQDARDSARRALEGGATVEEAAAQAELVDRQVGRDAADARIGALTTPAGLDTSSRPTTPARLGSRPTRTNGVVRPRAKRPAGRQGNVGAGRPRLPARGRPGPQPRRPRPNRNRRR